MAHGRRGGARTAAPGRAYPNRTDLNQHRALPAQTAPGQTYGAAQAQMLAQRQVPMAPPPLALPPGQSGATGGGGAAAGGAPPPAAPPQSWPEPGSMGSLERPSERPDEPVTSGAALGPGPGPEALPTGGQMTGGAMSSMLNRAAVASGSSALRQLAMQAANQGR